MRRPTIKRNRFEGYTAFRKRVGRFVETLDFYFAGVFGPDSNPLVFTGAIMIGLVTISVITGALMLIWYIPSPDHALESLSGIAAQVSFGSFIQATHRVAAELLVLLLVIHMIRTWATGRHLGARQKNWVTGMLGFPLVGLITWAGYILPWDERSMVFLTWGRELLRAPDSWPIIGWLKIGTLLSLPIISAETASDLLLRTFALHIGGVVVLIYLVFRHLKHVTPARIRMAIVSWVALIVIVLFIAAMLPVQGMQTEAFNPFSPPQTVSVDWILTFPLVFYPMLGAPILAALMFLIWLGLVILPRLEPQHPVTACVHEIACVGCRLCLQDCPYGAIEMVLQADRQRRDRVQEIAKIIPEHCNACGICVGSCGFDAIELPDRISGDVVWRMSWILDTGEPPAGSSISEGGPD